MSNQNTARETRGAHREIAVVGIAVLTVIGLYVSGWYFVGAFLCVGFAALRDRTSIAVYIPVCAGFLLLIGAYQAGKDMAKRDALLCTPPTAIELSPTSPGVPE